MTKDEILSLPAGWELDARIAKYVFGITDFAHPGFYWQEWVTETGNDGGNGYVCPRCGVTEREAQLPCVVDYSRDANRALTLLEHLHPRYIIKLQHYPDIVPNWSCELLVYGIDQKDVLSILIFQSDGYAEAETLPLAVCRAALLTTLEQETL